MLGLGRLPTLTVRERICFLALLAFSSVWCMPLCAQEHVSAGAQFHPDLVAKLPVISRSAAIVPVVAEPPPRLTGTHAFWDRENRLLFAGIGLFRALDYASTRNMQARGREEILLPDEVVNNSPGFASLETAGTAVSVGLSYWMHQADHHRLERWISVIHIGVTGFGAARNYSLKSKHPVPSAIR